MINTNSYLAALNLLPDDPPGGQTLILGEVVGALAGSQLVFLPFPTKALCAALIRADIPYLPAPGRYLSSARPDDSYGEGAALLDCWVPQDCDAIYFGTPTIVEGKSLFPQDRTWTRLGERKVASALCYNAGKRLVVSGLGSGDISLHDRGYDMGCNERPVRVVAYKHFGDFEDWVLVKERGK